MDGVQIQFGEKAPLHQFEIEIHGGFRESVRVHCGREVGHTSAQLPPLVLLPAEALEPSLGGLSVLSSFESQQEAVAHSTLPVPSPVTPAEDVEAGKEVWTVVGHQGQGVPEGPARIGGQGGRIAKTEPESSICTGKLRKRPESTLSVHQEDTLMAICGSKLVVGRQ